MIEDVQFVDDANLERTGTVVSSRLGGTEVRVAVRASDTGVIDVVCVPAHRLPSGTLVTIVGLNTRRELNGSRGTKTSWDSAIGRYIVALSADEKIKVTPGNVIQAW